MTKFLFVFMFVLGPVWAWGQAEWELKKEKNGISVFTRPVQGSTFKAFRGVSELETEMSVLAAVFQNVEGFVDWMPLTSVARLLKRDSPNTQVHYTVADAPWPVTDRDGVYRFVFSYDESKKRLTIQIKALTDVVPEKKGMVRVNQSSGKWEFTELPTGKIRAVYELHADPNGKIPAWLANSSVVDTPFNALTSLKQEVKKEQYQGKKFPFLPGS